MTGLPDDTLREQFLAAFGAGTTRSLTTERARWHWIDLSVLVDDLAGPLSKILETGRCAYVYAREDRYFHGVQDPAALFARYREWRDRLVAGVERFEPTSEDEVTDLAAMRQFTSDIWTVCERLLEIEQAGWTAGESSEGI